MSHQKTSQWSLAFILVVGLVLSGCARQERGADGTGLAGEYALVSVDGASMPARVSHDGVRLEVRSGRFVFKRDGTCNSRTVFVPPNGSEITREVEATYTMEGSRLTMKWKGAGITSGIIEGDTFTMNNEGMVFVYRKST